MEIYCLIWCVGWKPCRSEPEKRLNLKKYNTAAFLLKIFKTKKRFQISGLIEKFLYKEEKMIQFLLGFLLKLYRAVYISNYYGLH